MAAEYEELYHKIVKKFQETFFDAEGNMTAQTQTAHIVALYFQLTPEKYITKTVEGLKTPSGQRKRSSGYRICGNSVFLPCTKSEPRSEGSL